MFFIDTAGVRSVFDHDKHGGGEGGGGRGEGGIRIYLNETDVGLQECFRPQQTWD